MKTAIREILTKADKVRVGYGAACLLLLISAVLTITSIKKFIGQAAMVDRTNEVLLQLSNISNGLKESETGFHAYLIVRDKSFLEPIGRNRQLVDSAFDALATYVAGEPGQPEHLAELRLLAQERFAAIDRTRGELERNPSFVLDSARQSIIAGRHTAARTGRILLDMQAHARSGLREKSQELGNTSTAIQTINIASLVVSFLLAFYSFMAFNIQNRARQVADKKAADYRKRLEERIIELRKLNTELHSLRNNEKFASTGRIARTIAHEVRNPLTNINLAIDQLREDVEEQETNSLIEMVSRNSARINQLVTELLNATRFTELRFEQKSLNELVSEALDLASDRIELKQVAVRREFSGSDCMVHVDPEKMRIAFLNVIVNAVEAMESTTGLLTIRTERVNGNCVATFTDNGPGMNEEALQRVFEPYFTNKAKGNGLGMTNTQNIILNHKGSIRVQSEPGKGATFVIALESPQKAGAKEG